jgi:hypothetical protein
MAPRIFLLAALVLCATCDDDDDENTGQSCQQAGDCYRGAEGPLKGAVMCLMRVHGGYCTHQCEADTDCCAVKGECRTGLPQVCSPFESTGLKLCFLSCEASAVGGQDPNAFCQENAHPSFTCRSTGGGSQNRRVCVPGG